MIEITDGFTSISAGSDSIVGIAPDSAAPQPAPAPRCPTGARVTVEFCREISLPAGQVVRVRYDFAGDGNVREGTGVPVPIRAVVNWGRAVLYYYRWSHWIAPSALMNFAGGRRQAPVQAPTLRADLIPPMLETAVGATSADQSRA